MGPTTFAELVKQTLAEHGLNTREQWVRTRLDHVTVGDILRGKQPRMETVVKFARGFGLDPNYCLQLAGHEPVHNHTHRFFDEINRLYQESGDFTVSAEEMHLVRESPDTLEQLMEQVRARVAARKRA